jgi:hypothetical protein
MKHGFRLAASAALACTAVGAAAIAPASQANATTVTFDSFGGSSPLYQVPPGETLYTDFSSSLPSGATGGGALYGPDFPTPSQCLLGTCVAAPDISGLNLTTRQFFAVAPGQTETFTFGYAAKDVGVYIGSLDDENSLTINFTGGSSITYSGAELAVISGEEPNTLPSSVIPGGLPTIDGALTNGRWTFTDTSNDIIGITVSNGTDISTNSFEIAQITTSVPEPSTWAMMLLGFAGLGYAAFRRSNGKSRLEGVTA